MDFKTLKESLWPSRKKLLYFTGLLSPFFVFLVLFIFAGFYKHIAFIFILFAAITLLPLVYTMYALGAVAYFVFPRSSFNEYPYYSILGNIQLFGGLLVGVMFWWVAACLLEKNKKAAVVLILVEVIFAAFFLFSGIFKTHPICVLVGIKSKQDNYLNTQKHLVLYGKQDCF